MALLPSHFHPVSSDGGDEGDSVIQKLLPLSLLQHTCHCFLVNKTNTIHGRSKQNRQLNLACKLHMHRHCVLYNTWLLTT